MLTVILIGIFSFIAFIVATVVSSNWGIKNYAYFQSLYQTKLRSKHQQKHWENGANAKAIDHLSKKFSTKRWSWSFDYLNLPQGAHQSDWSVSRKYRCNAKLYKRRSRQNIDNLRSDSPDTLTCSTSILWLTDEWWTHQHSLWIISTSAASNRIIQQPIQRQFFIRWHQDGHQTIFSQYHLQQCPWHRSCRPSAVLRRWPSPKTGNRF